MHPRIPFLRCHRLGRGDLHWSTPLCGNNVFTEHSCASKDLSLHNRKDAAYMVRDNLVGMPTTLWAGRPGFDFRQGQEIFVFSTASRTALGPTQPPIQWVLRTLSPWVKQSGREADHSPPTGAEVKNTWIYTSSPYVFMA
jgi:hypothetical protein